MKYYKRWNREGDPFYVDEDGNLVDEATAKQNLVESAKGSRITFVESSAADVAAAKKMAGHLVSEDSGGIYKVASVDGKSVTLHGPIGKGGTKTISHKSLVSDYEDHGHEDDLDQANESSRESMEAAFRRHLAAGLRRVGVEHVDQAAQPSKYRDTGSAMDEAFRRFLPQGAIH